MFPPVACRKNRHTPALASRTTYFWCIRLVPGCQCAGAAGLLRWTALNYNCDALHTDSIIIKYLIHCHERSLETLDLILRCLEQEVEPERVSCQYDETLR